jgi:hypothetical protein
VMGRAQVAQRESMRTVSGARRRRPCTKGVAKASSAQAASSRSPEENVR